MDVIQFFTRGPKRDGEMRVEAVDQKNRWLEEAQVNGSKIQIEHIIQSSAGDDPATDTITIVYRRVR
jgi:hypothetical protein